MTQMRRWSVEIYIDEHADERLTRAEARLHTDDPTNLVGSGSAHRHPDDHDVAEIGDELAVARALSDLAHQLLHAAVTDIEAVTKKRAYLPQ
jgi:Rv2632c-like